MKHILKNAQQETVKFSLWGLAWLVITIVILTGCSATPQAQVPASPTGETAVQISPQAQTYVDLSQKSLSEQLDVPTDQITVEHVTAPATAHGIYTIALVAKGQTYEFQGQNQKVSLVVDKIPEITLELGEVAKSAVHNTIPAMAQSDQSPYWAVSPKHVEIELSGYAQPESSLQPKVYVYPVADLAAMNQVAADQIGVLKELMSKKPDLATVTPLPLLPLFNAQAMFYAQAQYQRFANGRGIRYLTQAAQAASPITNHEMFYTFQGLTDNGEYYIAVILPVAQSDLPADAASANTDLPDGFETYLQSVQEALEGAAPNSFSPALSDLDHLVQTISIQY